jgi:hypothetical protein
MPALYSLEESLERAAITVLEAVAGLSSCRIAAADDSDEDTLPCIYVRAEKLDELVLGMQTWNCRLSITLTASADETPQSEKDLRRLPDADDDDIGAAGYKALWKALMDTVDADAFKTSLNGTFITYVWGLEFEPIQYEQNERTFSRTIPIRVWLNEAYDS